jgi:hypothetical protein
MFVNDDFNKILHPHWTQLLIGGGQSKLSKSTLRLQFDSANEDRYTDAEINDTFPRKSSYVWKPPLRMIVKARMSHPSGTLQGTAGFGFWNAPFSNHGIWRTLPKSVWFFYSSPKSNMSLVPGNPGWGWKAQVIHTLRPEAALYALPLTLTMGYAKMSGNIKPAHHFMKKFVGAEETILLADMTNWHTYTLDWLPEKAIFRVDNKKVFESSLSPSGSLCFVAWIDNWYAIATPKGELKFGRCVSKSQWLDIDSIKIESLSKAK